MTSGFNTHSEVAADGRNVGQAAKPLYKKEMSPRTILAPFLFLLLHIFVQAICLISLLIIFMPQAFTLESMDKLMENITDPIYTTWAMLMASVILSLIYIFYLLRQKRTKDNYFLTDKPRAIHWVWGIWMSLAALGLTVLWMVLLTRMAESNAYFKEVVENYEELVKSIVSEQAPLWLQVLAVGIAAPIAEELLFRGIIQGEFRRAFPEAVAIFFQAVLFGLFHMNLVQSVYAFFPGVLFGLAYAVSRSIFVPILMHIFFNIVGGVLPGYFPQFEEAFATLRIVQIVLLIAGAGAYVFLRVSGRKLLPEEVRG